MPLRRVICCALLLAAGCSSSSLIGSWQNPDFKSRTYRNVLIVGVAHREDARRQFEDEFANDLKSGGSQATPSYRLITSSTDITREQLVEAVAKTHADAVLITRLVKREQRTTVTPGYTSPPPGYGGYYGYYRSSWDASYSPPIVSTSDVVTLETRLYDANQEALVWTGTTETFNPSDLGKDLPDLVSTIIKDLKKRQLL
jgi:hypothetical protein